VGARVTIYVFPFITDSDNNPRVVQVPYDQATGQDGNQAKPERVKVNGGMSGVYMKDHYVVSIFDE